MSFPYNFVKEEKCNFELIQFSYSSYHFSFYHEKFSFNPTIAFSSKRIRSESDKKGLVFRKQLYLCK